ncbi:MAG: hypothetical protein J5770_03665 [Bacteroidaceae bacterium]|nr:hypothetical protein [Bacteroidaceae bacterium]
MKKLIICGMVLFVLTSCIETQKGEVVKDGLAEVEPTQIEVGTVGDGTSMHSLELVGVFGDTLYFVYENNAVGGLACGDFVSVEYTEGDGELNAQYIVNLSALCHQWQGSDEAGSYSFKFEEDGSVAATGGDTEYAEWVIGNGQLKMSGENGEDVERFDIVLLTEDSLVLKSNDGIMMEMGRRE